MSGPLLLVDGQIGVIDESDEIFQITDPGRDKVCGVVAAFITIAADILDESGVAQSPDGLLLGHTMKRSSRVDAVCRLTR